MGPISKNKKKKNKTFGGSKASGERALQRVIFFFKFLVFKSFFSDSRVFVHQNSSG